MNGVAKQNQLVPYHSITLLKYVNQNYNMINKNVCQQTNSLGLEPNSSS